MDTPKTYFEQIPVAVVKIITGQVSVQEKSESPTVTADIPHSPEGWRQLAERIQQETDPKKMFELVQQMIANFDQENGRIDGQTAPKRLSINSGHCRDDEWSSNV